jgi:hypothetical protein
MSYASPIYSVKETARKVYHNNNKCTERNNIEPANVRQGTGGRPLCDHCDRLNREGK